MPCAAARPGSRRGSEGRPPRRGSRLLTPLLALLLPAPAALTAQEADPGDGKDPLAVLGLVVDHETGQPLEGVAVVLRFGPDAPDGVDPPPPVLTDARGRFVFVRLPDARYQIEISRIGYRPLIDSVTFRSAIGVRIEASLVSEAVELEGLLVMADVRSRYLEANGFYDRRRTGIGRYVTRDEIEARRPMLMTDLLRMMPGVRIASGGPFASQASVHLRAGCVPDVYLDGIRTISPYPIDMVHPDDVEAIEVYHGSQMPARFGTTSCGAVMVWTRVPNAGAGRPWSWKRALAALGFVAGAILLAR